MGKRQIRWETMDKDGISFATLAKHYLITCATEGKTPSTLRGYREKLNRFVRWIEGETLADFGVPLKGSTPGTSRLLRSTTATRFTIAMESTCRHQLFEPT